MKKFALVVAAFLALGLAACGGGAAEDVEIIIWDRDATDENPFYGETLTIASWSVRVQRLRSYARLYMLANPGVTIEVVDMGQTRAIAETTGREQIGIQLMAGLAPDMFDATLVDYLLPSVQNMMVDWRPLWMPTRILMKPTGL